MFGYGCESAKVLPHVDPVHQSMVSLPAQGHFELIIFLEEISSCDSWNRSGRIKEGRKHKAGE
jgi:hypothetical protein